MTASVFMQPAGNVNHTPDAAVTGGDVLCVAGRACIALRDIAAGATGALATRGRFTVTKTASIVMLDGCEVFWDRSAAAAILRPAAGATDRDFYLGTLVGDAASSATTCVIDLNRRPSYQWDVHQDAYATAVVKTAGTPNLFGGGGSISMQFSETAEAQKLDILGRRAFTKDSNWIFEAIINVRVTADADVADLSVGVASGTHASDADSIAESVFFHFDLGADLNIDAESDDTTGAEVAATDTTIDFVVGTPIHLVIDGRDPTDCQIYINGVNRLPNSVFTLAGATGPLYPLIHLEKSSNDSPGIVDVDFACVRIAEQ